MRIAYLVPILLYFLSGFCGLVYEIVWSRMLVLVMGNTTYATSTILASFMAGLCLGSYFWGRKIDSGKSSPLLVFGCLEIAVGLSAVVLYFIIQYVVPLEIMVIKTVSGSQSGSVLIRFLFSFMLLCIPTFFMGGTFAVIGKHLIGQNRDAGSKAALLYGVNTLGALLGAFLTGFFLIAYFGHFNVHITACLLNLFVGGSALAMHVWGKKTADHEPTVRKTTKSKKIKINPIPKSTMRLILMGTLAAGFATMAYQVLWTRLLVLVIDNSVYSFTSIVMLFLGGIALGSLLVIPLFRFEKHLTAIFALFQIAFAISAYLLPFFVHPGQVPGETRYDAFLLDRLPFFALVPALISGAILPVAIQIYKKKAVGTGVRLGGMYALNTLGCVLGAFAVSFFLIPKLGFRNTMLLLPGINLLLGCLVAIGTLKRHTSVLVVATGIVLAVLGTIWMPADYFRTKYAEIEPGSRLIYYAESTSVTATIFDRPDGIRVLYLNGIPEVDTSRLSVMTFRLMGALPNLLHPDPDNALMITFGAGITSGTTARFVQQVDSVDLAAQAGQISTYFKQANTAIHENPGLSLFADDARHYLLHTDKTYDVIVSDATHPRVYDSWVLFTREFYELVKSTLDKTGIFCQWVPFHGLHPDRYAAIIKTFSHVFPNVSIWRVSEAYSLMIATPSPFAVDFKTMAAKLGSQSIRKHMRAVGLDSPFELLKYFSFGGQQLARLNSSSPHLLSDNSPNHLFFPCRSTFKEQYDEWPKQNAETVKQYEESVVPYLINLGDGDKVKEKIVQTMKQIERRHKN
jgi:spermidine synthase